MRFLFALLVCCLFYFSCDNESKNPFNIDSVPLSSEAEFKASNWNGYNDFVFELKSLTENFSKDYAIEKTRNLLSKSQAILYSMPSDLRNEITNEKASDLVEVTKELSNSISTKTEEEIAEGLKKIIAAYTLLNKEINYYVSN